MWWFLDEILFSSNSNNTLKFTPVLWLQSVVHAHYIVGPTHGACFCARCTAEWRQKCGGGGVETFYTKGGGRGTVCCGGLNMVKFRKSCWPGGGCSPPVSRRPWQYTIEPSVMTCGVWHYLNYSYCQVITASWQVWNVNTQDLCTMTTDNTYT